MVSCDSISGMLWDVTNNIAIKKNVLLKTRVHTFLSLSHALKSVSDSLQFESTIR
jgi:hypothetical protein